MRLVLFIISMAIMPSLFGQHIDSILLELNQPLQNRIEQVVEEMFQGKDTIFTETDSFMLFTTPDMIWDELDTLEYQYNEAIKSYTEWNYNGDELAEAMAVVYLADKRTGAPIDVEANQYFVLTTSIDEETFEINYFEDIIACHTCGMNGGEPDISILTKENKIEFIEVRGNEEYIYNDEYKLLFEEGALIVEDHISAVFHNPTENLFSSAQNRKTMMEVQTYEPSEGEAEDFRLAVMPAEMAKRITVDGILDEGEWNRDHKMSWRPVHSTIQGEKHTMNDLFAKYSASWNTKNVYLALKVKDDKLVPISISEDGEISGDYIKLDFDFGKNRTNQGIRLDQFTGYNYSFAIGFDENGNAFVTDMLTGETIPDIKVVFTRNKAAGGYEVELQIPLSVLNTKKDKNANEIELNVGQSINFTVSLGDADNLETKEVKHIDASSRFKSHMPMYMGKIELFKSYRMKTLEEVKK